MRDSRKFFIKDKMIKKEKLKKEPKPKVGCFICKLDQEKRSLIYGDGNKNILIIGNNPKLSQLRSRNNDPFLDSAGNYLKNYLRTIGIDPKLDCYYINAVQCYKEGALTDGNINICRPNLFQILKENKIEKIITLGQEALQSVIGDRVSVTSITKWTGWKIPDQELGCWIYPIQTPDFVIDNPYIKMADFYFKKDLLAAIQHDEEFPNNKIKDSQLNLITEVFAANIYLEGILNSPHITEISFDYETTGLKPHAPGQEILCVSFSFDETATAMPLFKDKEFHRLLKRILHGEKIKKISQNCSFEDHWTKEILGYTVRNWYWDTMIGTHVSDNRSGITGLKFQTYVNYGISEYNKDVEKFIESKEKSANAFNKMKQVPLLDLLKYCAIDSLVTYRLYKKQEQYLNDENGKIGFDFFMEGIQFLNQVSSDGISINTEYFIKTNKMLIRKMERLHEKVMSSEEVQLWDGEDVFNFNSDKQLRHLIFDILKCKVTKKTPGESASVDAEALESLRTDYQFIDNILKWRKLEKIQGTYVSGILNEVVNNLIHTHYSLSSVISTRGSSSNPNLQNIPKRDAYSQKIIRTGIVPRTGRQLLEVDYGGIEVIISACNHQDPIMIDYIKDPTTDMHRDMGKLIFMNPDITKEERYLSKNGFVFPEFYGSYYRSVAQNLWKEMFDYSREHLSNKGIKTYKQFEQHIKKIEFDFWNKRFKIYKKWRDTNWNKYMNRGYIKLLTGFVCSSMMQEKDTMNYPMQGPAFHCLLWSGITINKYLKENNYKTIIVNQIHDSLIFDVVPEELEELKPIIKRIMIEDIKKHFDWIVVPMKVEAEISAVDGNWSEMTKIEL